MQLEKSTPSMWSNAIAGMFNNWSWFTFHFYGTTFSWFLRGQNSGSQRSRLLTELFTEAGPCGRSYSAVDQCPYKRSTTLWIQILDGAAKYWQHSVLQMFLLTFIVSWPLHWMLGPLTARQVHQGVSGLTISLNPTFNDLVGYDCLYVHDDQVPLCLT